MRKNNLLRYKGYSAKPEFCADDVIFYGRIIGIDDLVDFYAENVKELETEFQKAVDDYLEFCEEIGKEPQKEYSGTFNIRISPELHKQLTRKAEEEGVSLNRVVERALEHELDRMDDSDEISSLPELNNTKFTPLYLVRSSEEIASQAGVSTSILAVQ